MIGYLLRRILHAVPVLTVMSIVVFSMILLVPGDPVATLLGPNVSADPRGVAQLRSELLLDRPIPIQYLAWALRALHGDLGRSIATHQPVTEALLQRLPVTLELATIATLVAMAVAVPLGVIAAVRRNSVWDLLLSTFSLGGLAVPNFWLAILMVIVLAVNLNLLPASGFVAFSTDPLGNIRSLIMPAVALGSLMAAVLMRQVRASVIEVLSLEFIRTARAKGLSQYQVLVRHALPNALIAPLTVLGVHFAHLLGGSLVIESIFRIPGVGSLVVNGIFSRDFPVVQGGALMIAAAIVGTNIVVDLLYALVDPRITQRARD